MKIITLIPVKNEGDILENTLINTGSFSDYIIIADQSSSDNTLNICKKFAKVKVINNPNVGHSNMVRWLLLDEARKIDGDNLIFCIDADEIISPKSLTKIKEVIRIYSLKPGVAFSFHWLHIFESYNKYRVDGIWNNNIKPIAFWDDRIINYKKQFVVNDHTSRIPEPKKIYYIKDYPLLHLQSLSKEKNEIKQIWYRCSELIKNPSNSKRINNKYSITNTKKVILENTKKEWFDDIHLEKLKYSKKDDWRYKEILSWFDKYGIDFFETIDIWEFKEFNNLFVEKMGRQPRIKTYPTLIIKLNNLKNYIRNNILR